MTMHIAGRTIVSIFILFVAACGSGISSSIRQFSPLSDKIRERPALTRIASEKIRKVLESANHQTETTRGYTQKYFVIPYPNGDVPPETGACTDVVIRSFRKAGVDLQKEIHEDMNANFAKYPSIWGLKRPDSNIDHRRVPNLRVFFERKGRSITVSRDGKNFKPGDVVTWDLNGRGTTHTGVVSNLWNEDEGRYLIIHNIGRGTALEDRLFDWKITGHYRYFEE